MKKGNLFIYLSEFILLVYIIIFKPVIIDYFIMQIDVINIAFFALLMLMLYFTVGFPRRKSLINHNALQTIIICFVLYYVSIYIFGLFFGFLTNSYSLTLVNILKNIVVATIVIILKELYRYVVIQKSKKENYISLILVTLFFTFLDVIMEINIYNLRSAVGIFEFVEAAIIPNLALNALLSYLVYKFNYSIAIVFSLIYNLPNYFMPIFPDLGNYLGSLAKIIFDFVCYYRLSLLMERYEKKVSLKDRKQKNYTVIIIIVPLLIIMGLVSGIFKYHLFAIGSNSMIPVFAKGDAVLIEKVSKEELDDIQIDDIVAMYYNKNIIVHRVVSIEKINDDYIFKTKGDNNPTIDAWTTKGEDIYGRVKQVVKYIGIPSIELNEFMKKRGDINGEE